MRLLVCDWHDKAAFRLCNRRRRAYSHPTVTDAGVRGCIRKSTSFVLRIHSQNTHQALHMLVGDTIENIPCAPSSAEAGVSLCIRCFAHHARFALSPGCGMAAPG